MADLEPRAPAPASADSTTAMATNTHSPDDHDNDISGISKKASIEEEQHELVALPTEFNPDADTSPIPSAPSTGEEGEDELRVPIRSVEDEDAEEAAILERKRESQAQADMGIEGEEEEDITDFDAILQKLAEGKGEDGEEEGGEEEGGVLSEIVVERPEPTSESQEASGNAVYGERPKTPAPAPETRDQEIPSAASSPLSEVPISPLPTLPQDLPASPPPPAATPLREKRPASPPPPLESEAESSKTAAKRARLASPGHRGEGEREVVLPAKRARKQKPIQVLDFDFEDDLESISGGEGAGSGAGPSATKAKGRGGKVNLGTRDGEKAVNGDGKKAAPRKRKPDGSFPGQSPATGLAQASKGPIRPRTLTEAQLKKELLGKTRERQYGPCLRPRYTGWGKCTQCVGKVAGDSCRFKQFRIFDIDSKTADIIDTGDFEDTALSEEMTPLPRDFNVSWKEEDILRTERTVAAMLLPVISRELRHAINNTAVIREYDVAKHRSVCDFCSSTIFGGYFFCQKCGKDYCLQCERYFSPSMDAMRESPWDLPDAARPRLLRCTLAPPVKGKLAPKGESSTTVAAREPTVASPRVLAEVDPTPVVPVERNEDADAVIAPSNQDGHVAPKTPASQEEAHGSRTGSDKDHDQVKDQGQARFGEPTGEMGEAAESSAPGPPPAQVEKESEAMDVDLPSTTATSASTIEAPSAPISTTEAPSAPIAIPTSAPTAAPVTAAPPTQDTQATSHLETDAPVLGPRHRSAAAPRPPPLPKVKPTPRSRDTPRKGQNFHVRPDLVPITRFRINDLEEHWYKLVAFVLDGTGSLEERMKWLPTSDEKEEPLGDKVEEYLAKYPSTFPPHPDSTLSEEEVVRYYSKSTNSAVPPLEDPAGLEEKSHAFMSVDAEELDNSLFDRLWARGEPIVVNNVGKRFKQTWTPDTFIERFGQERCFVIECETEAIRETSVGGFFEQFKDPEQRSKKGVWKLKDWPSTNDFQSAYPDLYNDFCDSLPVPDFTRREGVLNLYSHFPNGPTKPDIGPKMYNAFEGKQGPRGQGSTRLHMDVADAINIMLYASTRPDGQPGCAVWDLFRAEDADTIRSYLSKKYEGKVFFTDPIHSQVFYLDSNLRKELAEKHGVVSWRVYQYPGQAVFIPAGCAHQVCNLADCIKIALDFVSPHNVSRCQQLMNDFRKENYVKAWKDDVLQLYNVMWYSWLNARETRQRRLDEANRPPPPLAERSDDLQPPMSEGLNGDKPHDRLKFLATQVSSVRDEPTPVSQPPSKEASPAPPPAVPANVNTNPDDKDNGDSQASTDKSATQEEDRSSLSKLLFEAMLKQVDNAPAPPTTDPDAAESKIESKGGVNGHSATREDRMRTTDMVRLGILPVDVALWEVTTQMKNEQEEEGGFKLDFEGL